MDRVVTVYCVVECISVFKIISAYHLVYELFVYSYRFYQTFIKLVLYVHSMCAIRFEWFYV